MKKLLLQATAVYALMLPAHADVTLMSWGGAYEKSQIEAYIKPFTAETGINVKMLSSDNPAAPIKSMVEAGNITVDVADLEFTDAIRLCDEGLLERLDLASLPPAPDGTPAAQDFLPEALTECAVGSMTFSTVYGFDTTKFPDEKPAVLADFFDLQKFPGKRGMRRGPKINLELALMADGVEPDQVYEVLATPEGVDRAFAKLDSIKPQIVWWQAGAQPPQLLADGEVAMTTAYNGRLFSAVVAEGKPFQTVWDRHVLELLMFAIPKDAPNKDQAWDFIRFATSTQRLADQTKWISYGPVRRSSIPLVGLFEDDKTEMQQYLPTTEEHLNTALHSSYDFWVDHETEITERFNAWLTM
ncbi:MAG: ABC transporter substrate-binding protein [Paracoccus sp. (in: a-proteobacteria)]|nr:ABC transporter substrate-binding protein [Paracoccus sp. (in: a-proteobacteria)]